MPMIDLTMRAGALLPAARISLMNELSEIALKWEGLAGNEKAKRLAFAYVHEVGSENFTIGGKTPAEAYYRIQMTFPEGAILDEDKAGLIHDATEAVLRAEGSESTSENRGRVWCIIGQVLEGNWGGGGKVFPYRALRDRFVKSGKKRPL
jgi:phenylpyruvate tautomerase PptA (4-oxalocrotonate tautomerase family)